MDSGEQLPHLLPGEAGRKRAVQAPLHIVHQNAVPSLHGRIQRVPEGIPCQTFQILPGGILVRGTDGRFIPVSGNQTGVLLADYLLGAMARNGRLPKNAVLLKTIVTTEMARRVAESHGVTCYDTFTGFKFMAEKKNALEAAGEGKVIFSYEESYGYMIGHYVRDKDAVTASMMIAEMAAYYFSKGMTLADALQGKAAWMKVGMTLFYANGPAIVYALKERGFKVFLDLKFHDIPHQVEGAAFAAAGTTSARLVVGTSYRPDHHQAHGESAQCLQCVFHHHFLWILSLY